MGGLIDRLRVFAIQLASVLIDSLFLAGWVLTNWAADTHLFPLFQLDGMNTFFVRVLKVVFAISTLFPVLLYIIVDLLSISVRAKRTIRGLIQE
jgi:hypothetical protein